MNSNAKRILLPVQFFAQKDEEERDAELLTDLAEESTEKTPIPDEEADTFGGGEEEWRLFVRTHPEVTELPREVIERLERGEPLRYAYAMYENEQLRCQLDLLKERAHILKKSPGSLTSDETDEGTDPFLEGLFGR